MRRCGGSRGTVCTTSRTREGRHRSTRPCSCRLGSVGMWSGAGGVSFTHLSWHRNATWCRSSHSAAIARSWRSTWAPSFSIPAA
eukprot:10726-Eustigmatos_ZCMA.PRE.1